MRNGNLPASCTLHGLFTQLLETRTVGQVGSEKYFVFHIDALASRLLMEDRRQ